MAWAADMAGLLEKGFYGDNLWDIAKLTRTHPEDYRVAAFVIEQVALRLAHEWDGGEPVTVDDAKRFESVLLGPMKAVVAAINRNADRAEMSALLGDIVRGYRRIYEND